MCGSFRSRWTSCFDVAGSAFGHGRLAADGLAAGGGLIVGAPTFPFLAANKRLLQAALGDRLAPGVEDYLDLFHDDAVLEIPYKATEAGDRMEGKAAIAAYMEQLRGKVTLEDMRLTASYACPGGAGGGVAGDTMVLEYAGAVHAERKDVRFRQRYIAVVTVRDGRIAFFREYTNPLLAQNAFAGGGKA